MKNLIYLFSFWLFALLTNEVQAQTYENLTLQQAIDLALSQNRNIKSKILDEQNVENDRKEALSPALPQVKGTASFQHNVQQPVSFVPAENFGGQEGVFLKFPQGLKNNASVGLEATQFLFNQAVFDGLKAVKVSRNLTKLQTDKEKKDLENQVMSVYYAVYIVRQQIEIVKANIETIQKTLRISKANFDNGLIRQLDYERIVVNKGNLETQQKNLQSSYNQQLNTLKFLMNLPLNTPVSLATEMANLPELVLQEEDYTTKRLDFQSLQQQMQLNEMERKVNQAGYYPTAQAFANYNYNWTNSQFSELFSSNLKYPAFSVGLRLNVPIFDGMQKSAKINKVRIKRQQLDLQSETLKENIQLEVANTRDKWQVSKDALENQNINKELAEKIYKQTAKEYEQGLTSLNELLQSENAVKETQSQYIEAMSNVLLAILEWKKATGN